MSSTEREGRDLQQVMVGDGSEMVVFDKARAQQHLVEPLTALDHSAIETMWISEFGAHILHIEGLGWMKVSKSRAHSWLSHHGFHDRVDDAAFKRILI